MLYLGTSGYSYQEWVGIFYPPQMPRRDWLPYYCREFNACEITSTFHSLPPSSAIMALVERSVPGFQFTVKAPQGLTHYRQGNNGLFVTFRRTVSPLMESGKLGCVVAQFPYGFSWGLESQDYLQVLRDRLPGLPLTVEFRHASWLQPRAQEWLRRLGLSCCYALGCDQPAAVPEVRHMAYIRLPDLAPEGEKTLPAQPWLEWLRGFSQRREKTFVFAGNWLHGGAIMTLRKLKGLLGPNDPSQRQGVELLSPCCGNSSG